MLLVAPLFGRQLPLSAMEDSSMRACLILFSWLGLDDMSANAGIWHLSEHLRLRWVPIVRSLLFVHYCMDGKYVRSPRTVSSFREGAGSAWMRSAVLESRTHRRATTDSQQPAFLDRKTLRQAANSNNK